MTGAQPTTGAPSREGRGVARNALFLVAGQFATAAISFAVTAALARHLGAEDYGVFYLAATLAQSAFVLADLGQGYYVVGRIAAQDGDDANASGALFGTGLALRLLVGAAMYPILAGVGAILGYGDATRQAISLTVIFFVLGSIGDAVNVVLRGLERMDLEAVLRVASKALVGAALGLAVIADARLPVVLAAQILGAAAAAVVYAFAIRHVAMPRPRLGLPTAASILIGGAPFLLWAVVVNAQPGVDAILLSLLAPPTVIGWHGAAWKLVGILVFPANLLATALYPTLSRLYARCSEGYGDLVEAALRATVLLGFLSAAGTYLFADTAVSLIYGAEVFRPAANNLRLLAAYLPLVFVDITLGTAIMASNAIRPWLVAKLASVLVAAAIAVVLIPASQSALGNGGLGCAAGTIASELWMFFAAMCLVRVDRVRLAATLAKDLGRAAGATAIMAGATWVVRDTGPFAAPAIAVITYFASSYLFGAIRREDIRFVGAVVGLRSPA